MSRCDEGVGVSGWRERRLTRPCQGAYQPPLAKGLERPGIALTSDGEPIFDAAEPATPWFHDSDRIDANRLAPAFLLRGKTTFMSTTTIIPLE